MNLKKIDFNLLKIFVTVYQEKSLKRAAERLFVTTPAVSQNIKKLRETLDEELFVLSHRQFVPTPYSDELYAKVFPLLEGISLAIEETKQFDPSTLEQSFNLDINPHLQVWLGTGLFKAFHEQSPKSTLILHTISPNTLTGLCNGSIDAAIHFEAENLPPEIVAIPITQLEFMIAMRRDHPFKKSEAYIDELLEYSFGHIDLAYLDPNKHSRLEDRLKEAGKNIHMAMRTTSVAGLISTIINSDIIGPCFPPTIEAVSKQVRLVRILDMREIGTMQIYLFIHQKNLSSPKYKWLTEIISDAVKVDSK
ncbi:LysR family transcriptional regulator [Vibrio breoganii]|uniref:LysR family transcriptional regulator n=1 Tax=Vibrio breoganii TaxID=553239 RepID=UPI000C8597C2|nr:LysR family transcriptional regulator [Vibrio breoganii]PMG00672.1 LysR family transcriptional regulator [Vibrio breoganii]PMO61463.1 LysR family transcriptional regulator [Vibrio breoganii]